MQSLHILPDHASIMIGDKACPELRRRGYDSDEYRAALQAKGITPYIPPRKRRILPASFDKNLYRQHHKVENMFEQLKEVRAQMMRGIIEHEHGAFTHAMTDAHTSSCPLSLPSSSSGSINVS